MTGPTRRFHESLFGHIKRPPLDPSWPDSWRYSHGHDVDSVWPGVTARGYRVAYRHRFARAVDYVLEAKPDGGRVLDLAAGQGNFSIVLAELGYHVTWNDLRDELVGYVRLKTDRQDIRFLPGNLFELPPERVGRFDAVVATEIIEHVAHPDDFLRKLAGFLEPGGVIVLTTPNGRYFRNTLPRFSDCPDPSQFEALQFKPDADGHIFLLYPDEIVTLAAKAGLKVDKFSVFNNPLTAENLKTRYLSPILPYGLVDAIERGTQALPAALSQRLHMQWAALLSRA
ncbi:MAG: methyltransferase domain-containing protein [Alphaproteobacteria bacterium]|nr:methyltransferase domain-containing protein [Alphaproteobacteria bacterium]